MKYLFTILCVCNFSSIHAQEDISNVFLQHWQNAIKADSEKQYLLAEQEFTKAITIVQAAGDKDYPYVYVDRGRLYLFLERDDKALLDLNHALSLKNLSLKDQVRARWSKSVALFQLGKEKEAFEEIEKLKKLDPNFPKAEFSKDRMVIRNLPKGKFYEDLLKDAAIDCDLIENDSEIQFSPSGICIINKKHQE